MIWSYKPKFKLRGRSDLLLRRYFNFDIWVHLPFEVVFIWNICKVLFGHISLSLKFREDPTSSCWDISLLIFYVVFHLSSSSIWGHLPLEVVFIWNICKFLFGHIGLSLKFWEDSTGSCWDISLLIFETFAKISLVI